MKLLVRPALDPHQELEQIDRLASAIAQEIWCLHRGEQGFDWIGAEHHLAHIVAAARVEAADTAVIVQPPAHPDGRTRRLPRAETSEHGRELAGQRGGSLRLMATAPA